MKALPYPEIIPGGVQFLDPWSQGPLLLRGKGGVVPGTNISEIHRYPLRPPGFEEPLFLTVASRRMVMEHLLKAPWLGRASELGRRAGEATHAPEEPVSLKISRGRAEVVRPRAGRCSRRRVVEVLERWREVKEWWDGDRCKDRFIFRVLLSGGVVVDLAREKSGRWLLVGVVD
jgi:hypothetical protein